MKTILSFALIALTFSNSPAHASSFLGGRSDIYPISEVRATATAVSDVDILWVIDNSGSMETSQNRVAALATNFFAALHARNVSAKIGLISTDTYDQPYLGFTRNFVSTATDAEATFKAAVALLGTAGDGTERPFDSQVKALTANPGFHRAGTPLVTIYVTDAMDQSSVTPANFWTTMQTLAPGVQAYYPMISPTDFGCTTDEDPFTYVGSAYQMLVQNSGHGNPISLCQDVAGFNQAGTDLVNNLFTSGILNPNTQALLGGWVKLDRAVPSTIKVIYNGQEIPSGPNGFWDYDAASGGIQFSSFTFAFSDSDLISINYEIQ